MLLSYVVTGPLDDALNIGEKKSRTKQDQENKFKYRDILLGQEVLHAQWGCE